MQPHEAAPGPNFGGGGFHATELPNQGWKTISSIADFLQMRGSKMPNDKTEAKLKQRKMFKFLLTNSIWVLSRPFGNWELRLSFATKKYCVLKKPKWNLFQKSMNRLKKN